MNATIATLLQLTAALLTGIHHDSNASLAEKQQIVLFAEHAIQLSTQAIAPIPFPIQKNNSIWPNFDDVQNAAYKNPEGEWVREGSDVRVLGEYTSFGDMNDDDFDDASVILQKTNLAGKTSFSAAALLNQGGVLFEIAEISLGNVLPTIYDHHVVNGDLVLDMQQGKGVRKISRYKLLGNAMMVDP